MDRFFASAIVVFLLFSGNAVAGELIFEYGGFYHKLKTAGKSDFADAKLTFRLNARNSTYPCAITSGNIVTETKRYPLVFSKNGIIHIPFDKQLKDDRAQLQINFNNLACDLQMRIEARSPKQFYSYKDLKNLQVQLHGLMKELAGVMSFFLATPQGLVAHMPSATNTASWNKVEQPLSVVSDNNRQIHIRLPAGLSQQTIRFTQQPESITLLLDQ